MPQGRDRLCRSGRHRPSVQVVDPAEETLPYAGRVEFHEMAGPLRFLAGKTEFLREAYAEKFRDQREALRDIAHRVGWSFHRPPHRPAPSPSC